MIDVPKFVFKLPTAYNQIWQIFIYCVQSNLEHVENIHLEKYIYISQDGHLSISNVHIWPNLIAFNLDLFVNLGNISRIELVIQTLTI